MNTLKVYEMTVLPPSQPQDVTFRSNIAFCSPLYNGGSRISEYEAIKTLQNLILLVCNMQVHIKDEISGNWFLLETIQVKPLSAEPDILADNVLKNLSGSFSIRVAARNVAGLGAISELHVVLEG